LSPLKGEHACHIEDKSHENDAEMCWKTSPEVFEESEESNNGYMTLGDDDEPYGSDTPLRLIQHDLDSAQANIA
jgi:hypothetical protein